MKISIRNSLSYLNVWTIIALGIVSILFLISSNSYWQNRIRESIPLYDNISNAKAEIIKGQMLFERITSHDHSVRIQDVWPLYNQAIMAVEDSIKGISNIAYLVGVKSENKELLYELNKLLLKMKEVNAFAHEKWQGHDTINQNYSSQQRLSFYEMERLVQKIEFHIDESIKGMMKAQERNYHFLVSFLLISFSLAAFALFVVTRRRNLAERVIQRSHDILEVTVAERTSELTKEKDRVQKYLDIAGVMLVALNAEGEITLINQEGCLILDVSEAEVLGKNWFDNYVPKQMVDEVKRLFNNLLRGNIESFKKHENPVLTSNGSERIIAFHNSLLQDTDGKTTGILFSGEDITEKKQAEDALQKSKKQYQNFLENINAGVVAHEPDTSIIYCNRKALQLLGLKMDQMIGKTAIDPQWKFLNEDGTDMIPDDFPINFALRTQTDLNDYFLGVVKPDKKQVTWLLCNSLAVKNDRNEIEHILISFFDVTDQKNAETEKANLESQLRQAHKLEAIGTMAGGIAHDFNNILAVILGNADMAIDDIPDFSPAKLQIEQVLQAANRAKDLVRHILTFSRMSVLTQDYVHIDLNTIVKEVLSFERSIIPTTIDIRSNLDEHCGQIYGDPSQIHQVIMNLCTNASHAMEEDGGILEISLHKTDLSAKDLNPEPNLKPGAYTKLSVADTGTGLTSDVIDKIFDPYFTTKDVGKGSGMGLAVVQGIVKKHGGFLTVESEPGKGCIFNLFFPLIEEVIISEPRDETEVLPTGTERILYLDDEENLANLGKVMLEKLGYSVTAISDSRDAVKLFQDDPNRFNLVITDQAMPNIPGSELSKQLLQIRPDLPIILCTGYSSTMDDMKALKIGISEYIMKPVQKNDLARLVRKLLDGKGSGT